MLALRLVKHALRMITGNLGQALKVSIGPYLILIGAFALFVGLSGFQNLAASSVPLLFRFIGGVGILALALFVFGWIAVSWHRFILLEERAGLLPAISGRPIWSYIGTLFLLGLRLLVIVIPVMLILSGVVGGVMQGGGAGLTLFVIVGLIVNILFSYVAMRWALPLPGEAIGSVMRFTDSWQATKPFHLSILGVVVILLSFNTLMTLVVGVVASTIPLVGFVMNAAVSWLLAMLGISILTTLYGHIVEGRDLP